MNRDAVGNDFVCYEGIAICGILRIMKKIFFAALMSAVPFCCFAQYGYTENSIIATSSYRLLITEQRDVELHYVDCDNPYADDVSTSSNPNRRRNDDGVWDIDYSRFVKPDKKVLYRAVAEVLADELPFLKTSFGGRANIWLQAHTDSVGRFVNCKVRFWADAEDYNRISPEKLARLYALFSELSFGVPEEYRDISDHYFNMTVPFRDL